MRPQTNRFSTGTFSISCRLALASCVVWTAVAWTTGQAQSTAQKSAAQDQPAAQSPQSAKAESEPLPRYAATHKRDPFQNLANLRVKPPAPRVLAPPPLDQRPPGLGGLLISEVSVIGFAEQAARKIVVLRGTDQFTYMAREGTKLYDGVLESIEAEEVTFERTVEDTAGNRISSKVVKR